MKIFPAIDLKNGSCVRLLKGDFNNLTEYNKDPIDQAKIFLKNNFDYLHVVDLDGAQTGNQSNISIIKELVKIDSFYANPAKFAPSSSIQMGAELFVYGFPLADDLSAQGNFTNGIVSAASGLNDDMTQFQMTAPIQPGNSGGPVLNRNGNVIGVVVATANQDFFRQQRGTDTQNINFAILFAFSVHVRVLSVNYQNLLIKSKFFGLIKTLTDLNSMIN